MPKWPRKTELRVMNQEGEKFSSLDKPGGYANEISPVVDEFENHTWLRSYAETSKGILEYVNPYRPIERSVHFLDEYGSAIMAHIIDFALAIRGLKKSVFDEHDAMMSLMMEIGARESVLQEGRRVALPLDGDLEADQRMRAGIRTKLGVDPLDVEGMLSISYPKP